MINSVEKLVQNALDSTGAVRLRHLRSLREEVKAHRREAVPALRSHLPSMAEFLYDIEAKGVAETTLGIFARVKVTTPLLDRLVMLQRVHPHPMVVRAIGLADPGHVSREYPFVLAEALAVDTTAGMAAEVLFRQFGVIDVGHTIQALENIALRHDSSSASEAISQLISHSEGSYGESASRSLENILRRGSTAKRYEIAVKLAWSSRRGLALLGITAQDTSSKVRMATARSLLSAYQTRGRPILDSMANDPDLRVRALIETGCY